MSKHLLVLDSTLPIIVNRGTYGNFSFDSNDRYVKRKNVMSKLKIN